MVRDDRSTLFVPPGATVQRRNAARTRQGCADALNILGRNGVTSSRNRRSNLPISVGDYMTGMPVDVSFTA